MDPDPLPLELFLDGLYFDLARQCARLQADRRGHPSRLPRHRTRHHVPHRRVRCLQNRKFVGKYVTNRKYTLCSPTKNEPERQLINSINQMRFRLQTWVSLSARFTYR